MDRTKELHIILDGKDLYNIESGFSHNFWDVPLRDDDESTLEFLQRVVGFNATHGLNVKFYLETDTAYIVGV